MASRRQFLASLLALLLAAPPGAALAGGKEKVLDRVASERSFPLEAAARTRLVVDNVYGRIAVTTHEHRRIDLKLERTVRGRSPALLERAEREVRLEATAEPGLVDLYINGPFRHPERREWSGEWRDPGYRVIYDFDLTVPPDVDLELKTVDGGTLVVDGVRGSFEVSNVNGGIEMSGLGGSGSAKTVNGPVRIAFAANPAGDSDFVTVNGDVEVFFQPGLAADLALHSTFGELWSEFEAQPLAARPPVERVEGGRRIIRTDSGARVRVGAGGPQISFKTLNGDVRIRRADRRLAPEDTP